MGKRRIRAVELEIGSVLPWDAYDEKGRLLLRKGHVVASDNQIERLIERGLFAEIDPPAKLEPVVREYAPSAVQPILDARQRLQHLCSPEGARLDFTHEIHALRALIAEACRLNQDAAFATALLVKEGRYSIRHSTDVAVACHLVGSAIGLSEHDLFCTVAAALTMNMSVLQLQDDLQAQKDPLTDAQRELIRQHPEESARMLRERGVTDELWIDAVQSHHETMDGSGYGPGRKGDEIPLAAQLVLLGDVYCARISSRKYRRALHPNAALRALFLEQGKLLREGLASHFIKTIGVFPAGTPVRLENGEIAVVTQRGESANTPRVCSVVGPRGLPFAVPIKRDTGRPTYGVREVVEWKDVGAPPSMQTLWGEIAATY